MSRRLRSWFPTIIFWVLFAGSIGLGRRYPWLDTAWYFVLLFLLLGLSALSIVYTLRHWRDTGNVSYRGIPRWIMRFFLDSEDSPR